MKFVTNLPSLGPLLRKCPGSGPQHKHAPFGFLSGKESHPPAFVQCLVHACCQAVSFSPPAERIRPEFHAVKWLSPDSLSTTPHKCLRPEQGAQHGAFGISKVSSSGSSVGSSDPWGSSFGVTSDPPSASPSDKIPVGIYATPKEFVQHARSLQHPMAGPSVVSDSFKSFLEHVTGLTEKLRTDEEALHRSFPLELQRVLKGKRLLLFRSLLEEYNYDDVGVWKVLRDGPTLTGNQDHPPYSERQFRPATLSTEQLERESCWQRASVTSKTSSPQDVATLRPRLQLALFLVLITLTPKSRRHWAGPTGWQPLVSFCFRAPRPSRELLMTANLQGLILRFLLQSAFGCKTWTMSLQ